MRRRPQRGRPRPGSDLRPDLLLRPVDLGLLQLDRVEQPVQVVAVQLLLLDHGLGDLLDGVLVEYHELARCVERLSEDLRGGSPHERILVYECVRYEWDVGAYDI